MFVVKLTGVHFVMLSYGEIRNLSAIQLRLTAEMILGRQRAIGQRDLLAHLRATTSNLTAWILIY